MRGRASRRVFMDRAYAGAGRRPIAGRWSAATRHDGPASGAGRTGSCAGAVSARAYRLRDGAASTGRRAFRCESPDVSVQDRRPSSRSAPADLRDSHARSVDARSARPYDAAIL